MRRETTLGVGLAMAMSLVASCGSGSGPRSAPQAPGGASKAEVQPPRAGSSLTTAQEAAVKYLVGLSDPATRPEAVLFAQKDLLTFQAGGALNAVLAETGSDVTAAEQLEPFILLWPLLENGDPWPILHSSQEVYPQVLIDAEAPPFRWRVQATAYDPFPENALEGRLVPNSEYAGALASQPPDQVFTVLAAPLLEAIAMYRAAFGTYPETPAAAFETLRLAALEPQLQELMQAYPRIEFFKTEDNTRAALLLVGPGHIRWLLLHDAAGSMELALDLLGMWDVQQPQIDAALQEMFPWGTLEENLPSVLGGFPS